MNKFAGSIMLMATLSVLVALDAVNLAAAEQQEEVLVKPPEDYLRGDERPFHPFCEQVEQEFQSSLNVLEHKVLVELWRYTAFSSPESQAMKMINEEQEWFDQMNARIAGGDEAAKEEAKQELKKYDFMAFGLKPTCKKMKSLDEKLSGELSKFKKSISLDGKSAEEREFIAGIKLAELSCPTARLVGRFSYYCKKSQKNRDEMRQVVGLRANLSWLGW